MAAQSWWLSAATIGGWVLAAAGVVLLAWALFHDRSRGKRRCPKCWYDMTGVPGLRCPECGREARREKRLYRTRRRWKMAMAVTLLLMPAAYFTQAEHRIRKQGWRGAVPNLALMVMANVWLKTPPAPGPNWGGRLTLTGGPAPAASSPRTLEEELWRRSQAGELTRLDRLVLFAWPARRVAWWGVDAPRANDRLDGLLAWGIQTRAVLNGTKKIVWDSVTDGALHTRSVWVGGEVLKVEYKGSEWFCDSRCSPLVRADWGGVGMQPSLPYEAPIILPEVPVDGRGRVLLELREAPGWPVDNSAKRPQVVWKRRYALPRLVGSCAEVVPQQPSEQLDRVLGQAIWLEAARGEPETLSVLVNVAAIRAACAPGQTMGARVRLLRDGGVVCEAKFWLSMMRASTTTATLALRGTPARLGDLGNGRWEMEVESDACAALWDLHATSCWEGKVVFGLDRYGQPRTEPSERQPERTENGR